MGNLKFVYYREHVYPISDNMVEADWRLLEEVLGWSDMLTVPVDDEEAEKELLKVDWGVMHVKIDTLNKDVELYGFWDYTETYPFRCKSDFLSDVEWETGNNRTIILSVYNALVEKVCPAYVAKLNLAQLELIVQPWNRVVLARIERYRAIISTLSQVDKDAEWVIIRKTGSYE